jgi:hypothetical protein
MKATIENGPTTRKTVEQGWVFSRTVETPSFAVALTLDFSQEELAIINQYNLTHSIIYTEKASGDSNFRALAAKYPGSADVLLSPLKYRLSHFMERPWKAHFDTPIQANEYEELLRKTILPAIKALVAVKNAEPRSSTFDV